jgi:hypothetical protein
VILAFAILGLSAIAISISYRQAIIPCQSPDCVTFVHVSINQPMPEEVAMLAQFGFTIEQYALYQISFLVAASLVSLAVAAMLFWHQTADRMALFMSFAFLLWATFHPPAVYEALPISWHWLLNLLLAAPYQVAWLLMFFLFPDGRFAPRWVAPVALARACLLALGLIFPTSIFNGLYWPGWLQFTVNSVFVLGIYSQIYKYRHISDQNYRQQTKWVVFALAAVLVIGYPFLAILSTSPFSRPGLLRLVSYPMFTLVPAGVYLAFGVAILRFRLWNIQVIINRTLVYGGLTAAVIGIYVVIVGLLSLVFKSEDNWISSILATGLIAVLFHPIRQRLQHTVNRLIYGQRDDPVEMLTHLAERLETANTPGTALLALVQTVANGLKLPYVALWLPDNEQWKIAAEVGKMPEHVELLPLFYQKQEIGHLVLAHRTPGDFFSLADRRLLGTIAQLVATTLHAIQVTTELRHSRHQIIASREEERRRIRRDLHDGLGPTLATQVIRMETAIDLVG